MKKTTSILHIYALLACCAMVAGMAGCDNNYSPVVKGNGKPAVVDYIRTPYPEAADSVITEAEKLQTIVVAGSNLQSVNRIYFDDVAATLNPTYITESAIILSVPFSETRTSKMVLYTSDSLRTEFPFVTYVPAPALQSLKCEYVPDGGEAVVKGSFFYEPIKVWFRAKHSSDSIEGKVTGCTANAVTVVVPAGAGEGPLTVSSKYGQTTSLFRFRDQTGLIANFNNGLHWGNPWDIGQLGSENPCGDDETEGYLLFKRQAVGEWFWSQEDLAGCYWDRYDERRSPFLPAGTDITQYGLRFEANVITWTDLPMHIWFANGDEIIDMGGDGATTTPQAHWCPWLVDGDATTNTWSVKEFKTDGWETFTIPLTEFRYDKLGRFSTNGQTELMMGDIASYRNLNFMVYGMQCDPTTKHDVHICLDNPRLVPLNPKK